DWSAAAVAFGAWRKPAPGRSATTICPVTSTRTDGCSRCEGAHMQDTPARATTQRPRISVGIIGARNIAGHHIPGYLQAAEHAQITAIADVDLERARKHTERLGEVEVFEDYREMIASADLDAVDICLTHHLHTDAIIAAA